MSNLKHKKMDDLLKAVKESIPLVIEEWNNVKLKQFESLYEQSFEEYFSNRETQEKTKVVSPVIDVIFARIMSQKIENFVIDEGKGRDYNWKGIPLENKLTLSISNSWTGNGYKKTDYHLLSKFELNEKGLIISYFSCLVNLEDCLSSWSLPDKKSNFSTLKFLNVDFDKIILIHGDKKRSKKFIHFTMVKM